MKAEKKPSSSSSSSSNWQDDLHENLKKLESLVNDSNLMFKKEDYLNAQQLFNSFITFLEFRSLRHGDESISASKIRSLVVKSSDDRGNASDVFIHRKSKSNVSGGVSRTNKSRSNTNHVNYRHVYPSSTSNFGLDQMDILSKNIETINASLSRQLEADAGFIGLPNPESSSNFLNFTPNSSIFSQNNVTNIGHGINFNEFAVGTGGFGPPINSNMFNNHNATPSEANRVNGVTESAKKGLDKLRGPDGELPQKLRNIPPKLIENVCNEIMDLDVNVTWDDIGGLHHAKKCVNEMAIMPLLRPDIFKGCRSPGKGVLLFGPPGTGKTMIGKAIAGEAKATFFNISASSVTSKYVGESEHLVRALFGVASCYQPAVIFVDEIDSLLSKRKSHGETECDRRMKTQFLIGMEGFDSGNDQILLIGATNKPQDLDEAARRRFTKRLYIPLPSAEARAWIVRNLLEKDGLFILSSEDIDSISTLTEGYSGSDMKNLVKDAAMGPLREALKLGTDLATLKKEDMRSITLQDFKDSLNEVRPSVSPNQLHLYEAWNYHFGSLPTSKTAEQVIGNSINVNAKKRKIGDDSTSSDSPPRMEHQTNDKVNGKGVERNETYYQEKLVVLKGIHEALQAKNKFDKIKLDLKQKKINEVEE